MGTYEDFLETVKKESAEFRATMEKFRKEETSYLEAHPELAAVNHEKANAFLYAIRAEDFPKLSYGMVNEKISDEIQKGHLLKENNFAVQDYIATYPGISMPYQNIKERTAQANLGRDKIVTFSSNWHPSDMAERLRRNKIPPVWLSVPPKEQELFQQLDGFRLEISSEAPCGIHGGKRTLDYNGFSALRKLNEELETEDREARTAIEQRFSLRGEHVELSLYYDGEEPLFHAAYESGKQELFSIINEKNGILPEHLQEPVATICKYLPYDSRPTGLLQKRHTIGDNFPTMEESRENYIKDCKADLNMKDVYQAANYYSIVTLLNPAVNSAEDFSKRMVEEMVKGGITQNRMMRIIEKSQVHAEMREKIKQIAQSPETKSALRKVRVQANVAPENDKTTDGR